jgi:hypothetical protein
MMSPGFDDRGKGGSVPQYNIDTYTVQLESGPTIGKRRVHIICRDSGTVRGWLVFYEDSATIYDPSVDATGRISLPFPLSRYASVMDLLRNEKPLTIYYNSPSFAGITSAGEPVGEQEG